MKLMFLSASKINASKEEEMCKVCTQKIYLVDKLEVKIKEKREVFHKFLFQVKNFVFEMNFKKKLSF